MYFLAIKLVGIYLNVEFLNEKLIHNAMSQRKRENFKNIGKNAPWYK